MSDKKSTGISWLDDAFDRADQVADGVGRALGAAPPEPAGPSLPAPVAAAFIDGGTGRWVVECEGREFGAGSRADAEWLRDRLNDRWGRR